MSPRLVTAPRPPLRRVSAGTVCAGVHLLFAVVLTLPLAQRFMTHLAGDAGDPLQTLWSWRWLHDALVELRNPFFTDRAYYPHGATLVFQTFDLPTGLLVAPLWTFLPPPAVYNVGVLFSFFLTSYGMYRLIMELADDRLAAVCAGVLFSATPYHSAHALGHQHLLNMGWIPLFLVHAHRIMAGTGGWRDGLLGGFYLALASLASWYHLLDVLVLAPVFLVGLLARDRGRFLRRDLWLRATVLLGAFLLVAGPLVLALFRARATEPVEGAHDAATYSADLQAFVIPNPTQHWGKLFLDASTDWPGNPAEQGQYLGIVVLVMALVAVAIRSPWAIPYLATALVGSVLALGPVIHRGGVALGDVRLPYGYLEEWFPPLRFMGVPGRLGYLTYLGLLTCFALALAWARARLSHRRSPLLAWAFPIGISVLALIEYYPRRMVMTELVAPPPMVEWSRTAETFSVLDLSGAPRMMWHATVHRKPVLGGYLSRTPSRLENWYRNIELIRARENPTPKLEVAFERTDSTLDFDWGAESPDPRLPGDNFRAEWNGLLRIPRSGMWTFHLASDDGSKLWIDGKVVVDNGGTHPLTWLSGSGRLTAGSHFLKLEYAEERGLAGLRLEWSGPGFPRRSPIPTEFLTAPDGETGLRGSYMKFIPDCTLDRDRALDELRSYAVRYVIASIGDEAACLTGRLGLVREYEGEGVRIYRLK